MITFMHILLCPATDAWFAIFINKLFSGIFKFTLEGNVLKAIEQTEQLAPDLLENNKDLHFDLLSLHFVELVCSRKWWAWWFLFPRKVAYWIYFFWLIISFSCSTEALEFAQTKLAPFGKVQSYVEKLEVCIFSRDYFKLFYLFLKCFPKRYTMHLLLQDFMALLAYEEPEKSPMFHLLSLEYRQQVADSLNRAILGWVSFSLSLLPFTAYFSPKNYIHVWFFCHVMVIAAHANLPSYSAVERLIQQITVVRQSLTQEPGKVWSLNFHIIYSSWLLYGSLDSVITRPVEVTDLYHENLACFVSPQVVACYHLLIKKMNKWKWWQLI